MHLDAPVRRVDVALDDHLGAAHQLQQLVRQLEVALDGVPLSPSEITASAIVYQVGALTALSGAELSVRLGTRWLRTFRLILVGG